MATQTQTRTPNWPFPAAAPATAAAPTAVGKVQQPSPPVSQKPTIPPIKSSRFTVEQLEFAQVRKKLEESRKLFLHQQTETEEEENHRLCEEKPIIEVRSQCEKPVLSRLASTTSTTSEEVNTRRPTKKISFKIRKNASIYRRKAPPDPKPLNLVQELTKRYNELDEQSGAVLVEQIRVVRRNSQNLKRRPSTKELQRIIIEDKSKTTSVKAAIAIFEQKCTAPPVPPSVDGAHKPQVPAKTFDSRTIAMRNLEKRMRLQKKLNNGGDAIEMPRCNSAIVMDLRNGRAAANANTAVKHRDAVSPIANAQRDASPGKMDACDTDELQVVSLPMATLKRCESNYECQKFGRYQHALRKFAVKPIEGAGGSIKPGKVEKVPTIAVRSDLDDDYEFVVPPTHEDKSEQIEKLLNNQVPPLPPRSTKFSQLYTSIKANLTPLPPAATRALAADEDDDYEIPEAPSDDTSPTENIYESLSRCSQASASFRARKHSAGRNQHEPLPPRPPSSSSSTPSIEYENDESNYYESIYSKRDDNYESIYGGSERRQRHSISMQSDQQSLQSNSIYGRSITSWAAEVLDTYIGNGSMSSFNGSQNGGSGGSVKAASELSGSSDDWVDISDHEHDDDDGSARGKNKFVIVREARHQKVTKKNSGWSQRIRGHWNKGPKKMHHGDTDSDHTYETLYGSDGLPVGGQTQNGGQGQQRQAPQPHPPPLHHHATQAVEFGAQLDDDDDFDSFESGSESDNSFAKTDSGVDMGNTQLPEPPANQTYAFTRFAASAGKNVMKRLRRNWSMRKNDISKSLSRITKRKSRTDLDTIEPEAPPPLPIPVPALAPAPAPVPVPTPDKNTIGRRGFLNKFKRSMSMTGDLGDTFSERPKSTFYVTDPIDLDSELPPVERPERRTKPHLVRPQMPPPPAPASPASMRDGRDGRDGAPKSRAQSWYAECGVFKPDSQPPTLPRRPNSFWYAEVGLYQSASPPSTSTTCSEHSGNSATSTNSGHSASYDVKHEPADYYYNASVKSYDSADTKKDEAFNSLQGDIQLRLQDEPLYQFYDAAVLESVCNSGLSDVYDDYEEIAKDKRASFSSRPSAMEIVSPRNNVSVARTLWCEIPEVVQSTVLSTLSTHQKKVQEAKFEMLTSEASYLNSLHVLTEHFVRKLRESELLNDDDKEILCGKILPVKECSEKLLGELEKCWQDNILLHGVCEIVKRHAEENFGVYVAYCENQIILDQALKRLKERSSFVEFLRQLEANSVCQLLTLYSFLMLPMQRITRWPLLVDAILKRLSPQDEEYQNCQYALATLNKIVTRCNEGARNMERTTEMRKIASQMEFGRGVPPIELVNGRRWLVRSGPLTQMHNRGDDVKLTFGKRFSKIAIHLFLFNDIIVVAKSKGDGVYVVQHYCSRSYVELNSDTLAALPTKDTQGRHLIFLTILENHDERTVEMLLSCASESDRERWLEALTPPKSENPEETLYECWDCPQVTAVHNYTANQPDELPITRGDVINVTRKMADGWYHGERIRDGETGWFPANYTVEVANPHVRARNLKQRYRLLAYSENYLKSK